MKAFMAIFGKCLNYKSGLRTLIWPTEAPFFWSQRRALWARFWPNFNFVDFWAYFGHFSLVKSAKNKIAFLQQKECSNKKIEENKSGLEFNFL